MLTVGRHVAAQERIENKMSIEVVTSDFYGDKKIGGFVDGTEIIAVKVEKNKNIILRNQRNYLEQQRLK